MLSSKAVMDEFATQPVSTDNSAISRRGKRIEQVAFPLRARQSKYKDIVLREDMSQYLLEAFRNIVIREMQELFSEDANVLRPCVRTLREEMQASDESSGCIFYIPRPGQRSEIMREDGSIPDMFELASVNAVGQIPVYDLDMLGQDHINDLRNNLDDGTSTYLLFATEASRNLQMALWKLRLYLDTGEARSS
jgi:hypothetical protein